MKNIYCHFAIKFLSLFTFFFIIDGCRWMNISFGATTMDQIAYHLQFGSEGLLNSDPKVIQRFIRYCLIAPLIFTTIILSLTPNVLSYIYTSFIKIKHKTIVYLTNYRFGRSLIKAPHIYALASAVFYAGFNFSAYSYITNQISPFHDDFFKANYVPPSINLVQPISPKNLILIYVESLETTYQNSKIFNDNLLKPLDKTFLGGVSFDKQRQTPGTGWTMAGIVATQCGIPLKPVFGGMDDKRKNEATTMLNEKFLPNITCLGDILKSNGYRNVFYGGASLLFAGKGSFFKSHGYDEIYGKEELEKQSESRVPMNSWGFFDDDLFKIVEQRLDILHRSGKPYNLTMLTLDTHQPNGFLSNTCKMQGADSFRKIINCTSSMIADFIERIKKKGYLNDTTVVVMGDHLAMVNPEYERLLNSPERFVFNHYISPINGLTKSRDEITHYDHLPSILDSIGLKVNGGKLGLGASGFQQNLEIKDNPERFEWLKQNITKSSTTYQNFWRASADN